MHPTLKRWSEKLAETGISRATTSKGILSAVKKAVLNSNFLEDVLSSVPRASLAYEKVMRKAVYDEALAAEARYALQEKYPRKKNLYYGSPTSKDTNTERWEKIHYKGAYKGWTGSEVFADYSSFFRVTSRWVQRRAGKTRGKYVFAPAGMKFAIDSNGVFLRRLSDGMDYHPTLEDFAAKDFAKRVKAQMAQNWKARQAQKSKEMEATRLKAIFDSEVQSCLVSLYDSRLAGNCVEGSLAFAERRLKMDRSDILACPWLVTAPASKLLATGEDRPRAACVAAWNRETLVSI